MQAGYRRVISGLVAALLALQPPIVTVQRQQHAAQAVRLPSSGVVSLDVITPTTTMTLTPMVTGTITATATMTSTATATVTLTATAPPTATATPKAQISVAPPSINPGGVLTVTGAGFAGDDDVDVRADALTSVASRETIDNRIPSAHKLPL